MRWHSPLPRPVTQRLDPGIHDHGQRLGAGQLVQQDSGVQRAVPGAVGIERGDHRLFDACASETLTRLRQGVQIKTIRIQTPLTQMDGEDLVPDLGGRQIDKKEFINATLADEFRWQTRDVVGGGGEKDPRGAFGHPDQQRAQNATTTPHLPNHWRAPRCR